MSEDCLFLDVFAPRQVFESAGLGYGAPVLVWIYGGGYTSGEKASHNPAGYWQQVEMLRTARSFTLP